MGWPWQRAKYIKNIGVPFVAVYHYNICTTDGNRPEKDQVLKTYVAILHCYKLFIKHLFICCGQYLMVNT